MYKNEKNQESQNKFQENMQCDKVKETKIRKNKNMKN